MRMASSHLFQHFFFFPAPTPLPLRPSIHASYSSSIFAGNARSAFLGGCGSVASPSPRFRADKKSWAMESKLIENGSRIKACSRQTSKRFVWSEERTRLLTKYLIDHAGEGKDALFREEILLGAAKAVSLQFQGVCDVASVRRRLRDLKKKWLMIEKLKASSVASWDHATRTITMQEDDYKQLFQLMYGY